MEKIEAYKSLDGKLFTDKDACIAYDKDIVLNKEILSKIKYGKFVEILKKDREEALTFLKNNISDTIKSNLEYYQAGINSLQYIETPNQPQPKQSKKKIRNTVEERQLLLDGDKQ